MKPNKKILLKRILVLCLAMFMVFGDVYSNSHLIMQVEAKSKPAAKPPAKPAPFINHNQNDVISKMFWKNLHTLFYTL